MTTEWHRRWSEGRVGFHRDDVHPDLVQHRDNFLGEEPRRVLVPLCGKSRDLPWLAEQGHDVVGVELVPAAVEALFAELGRDATVEWQGSARVYRSGRLTVINTDIFDVGPDNFGYFERIWDRAALVALPPDVRRRYTAQLKRLARDGARLLQNSLEYDPRVMDGPPFSVSAEEVVEHYGGERTELLAERDIIESSPRWRDRGHDHWWVRTHLISLP